MPSMFYYDKIGGTELGWGVAVKTGKVESVSTRLTLLAKTY